MKEDVLPRKPEEILSLKEELILTLITVLALMAFNIVAMYRALEDMIQKQCMDLIIAKLPLEYGLIISPILLAVVSLILGVYLGQTYMLYKMGKYLEVLRDWKK